MWETGVKTHTEARLWEIQCEKWKQTLILFGKAVCFWEIARNSLHVLHFFFSMWAMNNYCTIVCHSRSKKRPNYCWFNFPQSPLIVRSGKFSVSEQTKNSRYQSNEESVCYNFKEANITVSMSGYINIPLGCYLIFFHPTNDQCMLERKLVLQQKC